MTKKLTVRNEGRSPTVVHTLRGPRVIEPGDSRTDEFSDGQAAAMDESGRVAIEAAADDAPVTVDPVAPNPKKDARKAKRA